MSASPPPSPARPLPCQFDPEQWFDRGQRSAALAGCLACAVRPWCAQEALKWRASWGIWAGVWIDGRHDDVAPYLHAIAADDAAPIDCRRAVTTMTADHPRRAPVPLSRPPAALPSRSVPTAVLARSSGNCEVFAEGCRYTFDHVLSRCPRGSAVETLSPAALFAACAVCAEIVACLQPQLAARLGYLIDAAGDPASAPFYWRASRWVLLDRDGWLTETREDAQTA